MDNKKNEDRRGFLKRALRTLSLGGIVAVGGVAAKRANHPDTRARACADCSPCGTCTAFDDCRLPLAEKARREETGLKQD